MPTLTILPKGNTVEFSPGTTILDVLLGAEQKVPQKCDDKATCGACHIYIHDGRK